MKPFEIIYADAYYSIELLRIGVIEPAKFTIQQGIFLSVLFADEDCEGCEPAAGTSVGASNEEFPRGKYTCTK